MRLLAVAIIVIIALVTTTGCWLEADDAGGSDEERSDLRDYAAAMEVWWLEVTVGELSWLVPSHAIDHSRILDDPAAGYYGSDPLPSVEPPLSIRVLHELLVNTVIAFARAESNAKVEGFYTGVAAAFCDPRAAIGGVGWWRAAALQLWRWDGEPCRDGDRWIGNWRPQGMTGDPWRDFRRGCGGNYDGLWGFGVSPIELETACRNAVAWARAFDWTTDAWSAELIRLCHGQELFLPDPADALAACE